MCAARRFVLIKSAICATNLKVFFYCVSDYQGVPPGHDRLGQRPHCDRGQSRRPGWRQQIGWLLGVQVCRRRLWWVASSRVGGEMRGLFCAIAPRSYVQRLVCSDLVSLLNFSALCDRKNQSVTQSSVWLANCYFLLFCNAQSSKYRLAAAGIIFTLQLTRGAPHNSNQFS